MLKYMETTKNKMKYIYNNKCKNHKLLFSYFGCKLFYIFSIADSYFDFNANNSLSFLSIFTFLYISLSDS